MVKFCYKKYVAKAKVSSLVSLFIKTIRLSGVRQKRNEKLPYIYFCVCVIWQQLFPLERIKPAVLSLKLPFKPGFRYVSVRVESRRNFSKDTVRQVNIVLQAFVRDEVSLLLEPLMGFIRACLTPESYPTVAKLSNRFFCN